MFLWLVSLLGAGLGVLALFAAFGEKAAPQQAAAASMAVGLAVIPYCLARAWSELRPTRTEKLLAEINRKLARQDDAETVSR